MNYRYIVIFALSAANSMQGMEKSTEVKKITPGEWGKYTPGQKLDEILARNAAIESQAAHGLNNQMSKEEKSKHHTKVWLESFNRFFKATREVQKKQQETAPAFLRDFVDDTKALLDQSSYTGDGKIVLNFDKQYTLNAQLHENQLIYHNPTQGIINRDQTLLQLQKNNNELLNEKSALQIQFNQNKVDLQNELKKQAQKQARYSFFTGFGLAAGIFGAATWYFQRTK